VAIDDKVEKSVLAAEIRDESERSIQEMLLKSGMAGMVSLIPCGVGATITDMLTRVATKRTHERMGQMFDEVSKQIYELGEEKIDREWFRGEEFQTLLFEALHQLHVTQDKRKIEMLGKALANSGAKQFNEESRKELFLQLVRDLTPQHVSFLRQLSPPLPKPDTDPSHQPEWWLWQQRPQFPGIGSGLLILQTLAARGLVEEELKVEAAREPRLGAYPSRSQIEHAIEDFIKQLQKPSKRYFALSDLGMKFLKFVGLDSTTIESNKTDGAAQVNQN
jgi:hypothetical protein